VPLERVPQALRGHVVGEERGDEGAGAGADVDVEVAGGEVLEQRVEGEERPDLVQTANDSATGEHERSPRGTLRLRAHGSRGVSAGPAQSLRFGIAQAPGGVTIVGDMRPMGIALAGAVALSLAALGPGEATADGKVREMELEATVGTPAFPLVNKADRGR